MTREEAIAKAKKYHLQAEVIYCMDNLGYFLRKLVMNGTSNKQLVTVHINKQIKL